MFNEKSIHKKVSVLKSVEALKEKESINRQMLSNLKIDLFLGILLKISILYIFFQHASYGTVTYTLSFSLLGTLVEINTL